MVLAKTTLRSAVVILALVLTWQLIAGLRLVDPIILPAPLSVLRAASEMFLQDGLTVDLLTTLARVAAAITFAAIVGVPIGLFFGYRRKLYSMVEAPLHALRSLPASALFPLFLILIGVGEASIVALAAYPSLLIILVGVSSGARLANKRRLRQAKQLGLSAWEIITEFLFFESLPSIITGVRTAVSYAMVLVIAVEMFIGIGANGLGRKIYLFQSTYQIPKTYAAIIMAGVLGVCANFVLNAIERRSLRWLPHAQEESEI